MGGAFGGKVTRPCQIAAGAALAAWKLGRKVHLAVTRDDDLRMNGGMLEHNNGDLQVSWKMEDACPSRMMAISA